MKILSVALAVPTANAARLSSHVAAVQAVSPFETWASAQDTPDCPAHIKRSTCPDDQFRGLIVFFHGFSACSDQASSVSDRLADMCVDVLAPTLPGHGYSALWCGDGGAECDSVCGNGMGWAHASLPTHKQPYSDFVRSVHAAVKEEFEHRSTVTGRSKSDLEVSLVGLSFGSAMALKTAMLEPSFYSRQLLVNPYFALGDEEIDQKVVNCEARIHAGLATHAECVKEGTSSYLAPAGLDPDSMLAQIWLGTDVRGVVRSYFGNLVKLSDAVGASYQGHHEGAGDPSIGALMEAPQEWGANCNAIWNEGRGGFCKFKQKHLLSTHSFALHALVTAFEWGTWLHGFPVTQILSTERDGRTRNGLSYDLARHLHSINPERVSMCMYKFQAGTNRADSEEYFSDENSMPHASLKGTRAAGRWWEEDLFRNVGKFLIGGRDSVSEPHQSGPADRNICEEVPLEHGADVSELVDVGVSPTDWSELWPGVLYGILGAVS